jgi:MscS family membrane protein
MRYPGEWRSHLGEIAITPIRIFLWVLFFSFSGQLIAKEFGIKLELTAWTNIVLVVCAVWVLLRGKRVIQHAVRYRFFEPGPIDVLGKIFSAFVVFLGGLVILRLLGLDVGPLVAFGGVGAVVLGFACKDVIANFYGGLMIHLTRPFIVHDLIELPQKNVEGTVEEIGWYFTALRDLHKRPIYVPNAAFTTELLVNQSRLTHRRIDEKLSLRYEDVEKVPRLVESIRRYLEEHHAVDKAQSLYVSMLTFGPSAIVLEVKAYTLSTRYLEFIDIRQEVLLGIYEIFQRQEAEMPFPITEVRLIR